MSCQPQRPGRAKLLAVVLCLVVSSVWAQTSTAQLLKFADQIMAEVSNLRGLEIKRPVEKGVTNQKEIGERLRENLNKDSNLEKLEIEGRVLRRLGLVPPDYDLIGSALGLINEQMAGYYDPAQNKLFIAESFSMEQQRMTLAHELVHALQDQHFDLSSILDPVENNDDHALARRAVVEGEAVAVMLDHLLRPMKRTFLNLPNLVDVYRTSSLEARETYKALAGAPEFLRETLTFPYSYGARFVQVYRKWHPWEDMEKVYADMPRSTEQILHPHKYTGKRDDPQVVQPDSPADPVPGNWQAVHRNVLGEFVTYLWLKQHVSEPTAKSAARGWDGDSFQYFESDDGRAAYYLQSVWDSENDAAQFFEAYSELVEAFPGGLERIAAEESFREWVSGSVLVRAERQGATVAVYEADLASQTSR